MADAPINIVTNPARPQAYVTGNLMTVYVIDTAANAIVTSIPLPERTTLW